LYIVEMCVRSKNSRRTKILPVEGYKEFGS
jgi:hypothetical protein